MGSARHSSVRHGHVEPLESRRLMSLTPFGAGHALPAETATSGFDTFNNQGDLQVYGGDAADHVIVERVRENLFVNVNGVVRTFAAADVQYLSINGLGGDDDIVNNTAIASAIHGGDGNDTIWGGAGDDRIRGQGGDDVLRGGDGNDAVRGESGGDFAHGGDGRDELVGAGGEDTLIGGSDNDGLHGDRGSDSLYGEGGDDVLLGGDAPDYLEAGAGDDVLVGGEGGDAMFGLAGNDRFGAADDGAADTVRGGVGTDRATVDDDEDDVLAVETLS
jgi:Ca2+-binding RTX toxin-like protein